MVILLGLILCAVAAGAIGARKGEPIMAAVLGLFLGPLGILFALLSKGNRIACPFCREMVDPAATVCKACRSELRGVAR